MATYIHDASNEVLYEIPDLPFVNERRDAKGKRLDWVVNMNVLITRADNVLVGGRWKYPRFTTYQEHYDLRDSRDQATSFFLTANSPPGTPVTEAEFTVLKQEYESRANNNTTP